MKNIKLLLIVLLFLNTLYSVSAQNDTKKPNIVVIFCDDLGYGDLGIFGHPTIKTPVLDKMAMEGQKWTSFYVAASVCTPSRAGLLTGRLPVRSGMASNKRAVLFPDSNGGLPQSEITIPEALKQAGYATGMVGKWHLGHLEQYLPTNNGFDSYYGIPYSNDMDAVKIDGVKNRFINPRIESFNVPLLRDTKIIERPADQTTITKRYTEEAVKYINTNKDKPFFLYLAHSLPHVPLFRAKAFENTSRRGLYGDVIEEIDWSVGEVRKALEANGIAENTLVVFTSDNGPWLSYGTQGGSAGLLRSGKGTTFEGGMRVPTVFWWKNKLKKGVVNQMGSTLDLLPTFCDLVGAKLPKNRILDGKSLKNTLLLGENSPREEMFFYKGEQLFAIRKGSYKAHFKTREKFYGADNTLKIHEVPLLYNLDVDPSEKHEISMANPQIVADILKLAEEHKTTVKPVENQLEKRIQTKK